MRAQVVLVQGNRILLARHERYGHSYWVLPGGAVEEGETPEEAAVREVREETALEVRLERLLFVDGPRQDGSIVIKSPRYTFLGQVVGGVLCSQEDRAGGHPEKGFLAGTCWMPFEAEEYDAATRDTLRRVKRVLEGA
jgi:ADP-ribose pyrophosphatase YjhB (NUDIX family)